MPINLVTGHVGADQLPAWKGGILVIVVEQVGGHHTPFATVALFVSRPSRTGTDFY